MEELKRSYTEKREDIKKRLSDFKSLKEEKYIDEFMFCTLTPQSNAQKCWQAVLEVKKLENKNVDKVAGILKSRTRFHNNKAKYLMANLSNWKVIESKLNEDNIVELRNWLAENVNGYGLKEAGHFLRNIGKSENKIAILDRHILRNLKGLGVIDSDEIKGKKDYFEIEKQFLAFSDKIGIPIDELDLLFWSNENGEIFK